MKIIETKAEYEEILKNNKSVFVDFYADWCGPCKMLGPVLEEVSKETPEVTFVKVNIDNLQELAQMYGIMSIPTMLAFKNGEIVNKTVGFIPKEELIQEVKKAL